MCKVFTNPDFFKSFVHQNCCSQHIDGLFDLAFSFIFIIRGKAFVGFQSISCTCLTNTLLLTVVAFDAIDYRAIHFVKRLELCRQADFVFIKSKLKSALCDPYISFYKCPGVPVTEANPSSS
ncbi:unnamed protein product [Protopolystoma xenopodis]|uniref:Uncharacterized protein n=1 Tax=Protopolystoma xenopodis TaxID=117903 RepID=A0A448WXQ2_9PLAT|nr:unnamed protein product [Protopolystoma xenopodis]